MGCAAHGAVDVHAVSSVHQVALIHHDVEAAGEGLGTSSVSNVDGVHHPRHVGGWEVVGRRDAAAVAVAGAALIGLSVLSRGIPFNGRYGEDEQGHEDQGDSSCGQVHGIGIVTLHIRKLVYRLDNAHPKGLQNQRGAIK